MIGTGVVLFALAGCAAQMEPARILANGQIRWSDGIKEGMHVSPTGSKLTFANYSNEVGAQPVTIFLESIAHVMVIVNITLMKRKLNVA
ncbi:hypothetical protein Q8W17_17805 [Photobacterium damselae subsp. piscicida]|nr:hypothetical protein [Photobacterium damselae subsp. piscicida]